MSQYPQNGQNSEFTAGDDSKPPNDAPANPYAAPAAATPHAAPAAAYPYAAPANPHAAPAAAYPYAAPANPQGAPAALYAPPLAAPLYANPLLAPHARDYFIGVNNDLRGCFPDLPAQAPNFGLGAAGAGPFPPRSSYDQLHPGPPLPDPADIAQVLSQGPVREATLRDGDASRRPINKRLQLSDGTPAKRAKGGEREAHNDSERRYRDMLQKKINELAAVIPDEFLRPFHTPAAGRAGAASDREWKPSKKDVLTSSVQYIEQLKEEKLELVKEKDAALREKDEALRQKDELMREKDALSRRIEKLERWGFPEGNVSDYMAWQDPVGGIPNMNIEEWRIPNLGEGGIPHGDFQDYTAWWIPNAEEGGIPNGEEWPGGGAGGGDPS